jgi:periplasmic iron binding protein
MNWEDYFMKKTLGILTAFAVISTVGLIGCGSADNSPAATTNSNAQTSQKDSAAPDLKDGAGKMMALANELKTEITSSDESKIKTTGSKLNETWSSFEDGLKAKSPDLYGDIEKYLNPIVAASGASPIDKKILSELDDQLIQTLHKLSSATASTHQASTDAKSGGGDDVQEISIGAPASTQGMIIHPVYFDPAVLVPAEKAGLTPAKSDIHLEVDIHAAKDNQIGFGEGDWIPYLTVNYTLTNENTNQQVTGTLMPMNADDGPHYGANVKMLGTGKYKLSLSMQSPESQNYLLHKSEGTVPGDFWTAPIKLDWEFPYLPKH